MFTHVSAAEQLRSVKRVLSAEVAKTVVYAFISSRLDYCNSLLFGISDNLLERLQAIQTTAVQHTAAFLVTYTRRRKHITPVLGQVHCLPVRQRIECKLVQRGHV